MDYWGYQVTTIKNFQCFQGNHGLAEKQIYSNSSNSCCYGIYQEQREMACRIEEPCRYLLELCVKSSRSFALLFSLAFSQPLSSLQQFVLSHGMRLAIIWYLCHSTWNCYNLLRSLGVTIRAFCSMQVAFLFLSSSFICLFTSASANLSYSIVSIRHPATGLDIAHGICEACSSEIVLWHMLFSRHLRQVQTHTQRTCSDLKLSKALLRHICQKPEQALKSLVLPWY